MKKKYEAIIFDVDGTIIDSDMMLVNSFNVLYDLYRDGKKTPQEEIYYFSGPPIRETLKKEFPHMDLDFMHQEYLRISPSFYETSITQMEGIEEVLKKLKQLGFKLGVVTNKARKSTDKCLKMTKLDRFFDVVIGFDDVSEGKPSPEGLNKAMNLLNVNKESTLYVGDNVIDDLCAKNAGVDSAIVYFGRRTLPEELNPTIKLDSFITLLKEAVYE